MITLVISISVDDTTSMANIRSTMVNTAHLASGYLMEFGMIKVDEQMSFLADHVDVRDLTFYRSE